MEGRTAAKTRWAGLRDSKGGDKKLQARIRLLGVGRGMHCCGRHDTPEKTQRAGNKSPQESGARQPTTVSLLNGHDQDVNVADLVVTASSPLRYSIGRSEMK